MKGALTPMDGMDSLVGSDRSIAGETTGGAVLGSGPLDPGAGAAADTPALTGAWPSACVTELYIRKPPTRTEAAAHRSTRVRGSRTGGRGADCSGMGGAAFRLPGTAGRVRGGAGSGHCRSGVGTVQKRIQERVQYRVQ